MANNLNLQEIKLEQEALKAEADAEQAELNLAARLASPFEARELMVASDLSFDTVLNTVNTLDHWRRIGTDSPVRLLLNTARSGLIQSLALHDYLRWLRMDGVDVTVEVAGYGNGNAALVLQGGTKRLMNPQSALCLDEVSRTVGNTNTFEAGEELDWLKRLQTQQRRLLTERSPILDGRQLANRTRRKGWLLPAAEAVAQGLADGIATSGYPCQTCWPQLEEDLVTLQSDTMSVRKRKAEARKLRASTEIQRLDAIKALAAPEHSFIVPFFGPVGDDSAAKAIDALGRFARRPGKDITVRISSPGGSVYAAFGFINLCQQVQAAGRAVNTEVLGYAASMGGVMLQMGKKRTAGKESWMLIHRVSNWFGGTTSELDGQWRDAMETQRICFEMLASKSVFTADEILERCRDHDWWISADEMLKWGFVDEIR